jgi:predicted enzyme related to lactoylglutathione lyase
MKIRGICWVGVKTGDRSRLAKFFHQVMGLSRTTERTNFTVFELPNDDKFELFGPKGPDSPELFSTSPVVCGFLVDGIEKARSELASAGIELLGAVQYGSSEDRTGYAWQNFRGPDGLVYVLCQDPKHS